MFYKVGRLLLTKSRKNHLWSSKLTDQRSSLIFCWGCTSWTFFSIHKVSLKVNSFTKEYQNHNSSCFLWVESFWHYLPHRLDSISKALRLDWKSGETILLTIWQARRNLLTRNLLSLCVLLLNLWNSVILSDDNFIHFVLFTFTYFLSSLKAWFLAQRKETTVTKMATKIHIVIVLWWYWDY